MSDTNAFHRLSKYGRDDMLSMNTACILHLLQVTTAILEKAQKRATCTCFPDP